MKLAIPLPSSVRPLPLALRLSAAAAIMGAPVAALAVVPQVPPPNAVLMPPAFDGNAGMGQSLAVSDSYILVGAPGFDGAGGQTMDSGAVYVFNASTRQYLKRLTAPVPTVQEQFGQTVAVRGRVAYVGAGGNDNLASNGGAVYAFDIPTGRRLWVYYGSTSGIQLGSASMAVAGPFVAVGVPLGQAAGKPAASGYVVLLAHTTGSAEGQLTADTPHLNDHFGQAMGASGNYVAVGIPGYDGMNTDSGAVMLFDVVSGAAPKLLTSDSSSANLGASIAIQGRFLMTGGDGVNVCIFNTADGTIVRKLIKPGGVGAQNTFGDTLAVIGDLACIGEPDANSNAGRVLVIDIKDMAAPMPYSTLAAPAGLGAGATFGRLLASSNGRLLAACSTSTQRIYHFEPIRSRLSSTTNVIATTGALAPGVDGPQFANFGDYAINQQGEVIFSASLKGQGVKSTTNQGVWSTLSGATDLVARAGDAIGGGTFNSFPWLAQNGTARGIFASRLSGSGNPTALYEDNGSTVTEVAREGNLILMGRKLGRIVAFNQPNAGDAPAAADRASFTASFVPGVADATPANDSFVATTTSISIGLHAREGSPSPVSGLNYGQILPRLARLNSDLIFASFLAGAPASADTALFRKNVSGGAALIARKGDSTPGAPGGKFGAFLGESVSIANKVVFRASVTGVPSSRNEGIWTDRMGTLELIGQKSPGGAAWVTIIPYKRVIRHFILNSGVVVLWVQMGGPGINAGNDGQIWAFPPNGQPVRIFAEGDPADSCGDARIGAIQSVDFDMLGRCVVLASLTGTSPSRNQGLFMCQLNGTPLSVLCQPKLIIRKGDLVDRPGAEQIRSISLSKNTATATGAGSTGSAKVIGGPWLAFILDFNDGVKALTVLRP